MVVHQGIFLLLAFGVSLKPAAGQMNADFESAKENQSLVSQDPAWITNHPDATAVIRKQDVPTNQYLELKSPGGGLRTTKDFQPLAGTIKSSFDFNLKDGGLYIRYFESPQSTKTMLRNIGFDILSDGRIRAGYPELSRSLGTIGHGIWIRATLNIEFENGQVANWSLAMKNLVTGKEIPLNNAFDLPPSSVNDSPSEIGGLIFSAQKEKGVTVLLDNVILTTEGEYPKTVSNPAQK